MINWLDNPHANYVLTAYGLAAACLIGLLIVSWMESKRSHALWQKLRKQKGSVTETEDLT